MIVSQVPPSLESSSLECLLPTLMPFRSSLRIRRKILPPGVWMASFAGFRPPPPPLAVLGFDPLALEAVMLMAEPGRTKGIGLAPPGLDDGVMTDPGLPDRELGCWRTAKTNVLLRASRWH